MEKIKVGIVGLGQRGRDLTKTVLCCEEVEVVALCELYEDRLANIGKLVADRQGKAPTLYEKYEDMLADERVGTVLICSSWDEHIRMAVEIMARRHFREVCEMSELFEIYPLHTSHS